MALSLQLGYPDVPRSITNPNVSEIDALDSSAPMSFLVFIKTISISFEPDILQNYYNEYLKKWNLQTQSTDSDNRDIIVEQYRDFIKDISLNYTTLEERKFLSQLNFDDPYDLDIAIPFYSKKLKEIAQYYNKKREESKFEITKKKLKGSNLGLEKSIINMTLSYLESRQDSSINYDFESIKSSIEVEIEELYDVYPEYFNQDPDPLIYDNKDLDYGENIFLLPDDILINKIFSDISDTLKEIKEVDQLFNNKRKLTKKYISTNFYFLSTGSTVTDFLSGKLFDCDKPISNFLNIDFPTTASTQRNQFKSPRQVGFFRPHKTSIILVDGKNLQFSFNLENLAPNSLYYFPDPLIHGNTDNVITFIVDDTNFKRNFSSGSARNQPLYQSDDVSYYGYASKYDINKSPNLNGLFEKGYIHDLKHDIYNNIFGLFKDNNNFKQSIEIVDKNIIKNLQLDGYVFYDELYSEGFTFDYSIFDDTTYTETIRSGLSSYTNSFILSSNPYTLFFRYFTPYEELIEPTEDISTSEFIIRDGAFFLRTNGEPYDDPISSDLSAFPGSFIYYYSDLLEAGLHTVSPLQRALLDPTFPSLTANFTQSGRPLANNSITDINGGKFTDNFVFDFTFNSVSYPFSNEVFSPTTYLPISSYENENIIDRNDLEGTIYVKNSNSQVIKTLLDTCDYMNVKYSSTLVQELSTQILNFDLANDILFIETPNYLLIDKIVYNNGIFNNPKTSNIVITKNENYYDKVSSRYKVGNFVYYCTLQTLTSAISSNNFILYPEIYRFDLFNFKNEKLFPLTLNEIIGNSSFYTISGGDVRYTSSDSPILTYSSRNNMFNLSFILKDQNNFIFLQEYDFEITPDIKVLNHKQYRPTNDQISNIFLSSYSTELYFNLSTGTSTISSEEYIL